MSSHLTRSDALEILELEETADLAAVKRSYRRLVRSHHPDRGGDAAAFQRLQDAYERLVRPSDVSPSVPVDPVRQPSRPVDADWGEPPGMLWSEAAVDISRFDWDRRLQDLRRPVRLDASLVAATLALPDARSPVHPLAGYSRGPRSPLNRVIGMLDPDLTAAWRVAVSRDAGVPGHDVEVRLHLRSRSARRRLAGSTLPTGWVQERGSSSATLQRTLHPSRDRRRTAARVTDHLTAALDALEWPLTSWYGLPSELDSVSS